MRYTRPSFYEMFSCIGSECRHNCCIGWEIDVDDDTAELYASVEGTLGKELREKISTEGERYFCMQPDGRCPFLNEQNLCRVILTLGEDALCDICALHPRFFNSYPGREEAGLGLCCEEAVRLLLTAPEGFCLIEEQDGEQAAEDEWTEYLAAIRKKLLAALSNESKPFSDRYMDCCAIMQSPALEFDPKSWVPFYRSLEQMDRAWGDVLKRLTAFELPVRWIDRLDMARYGRLFSCFLYRHFLTAKDGAEVKTHFAFCALSTAMIAALDTADPSQADEHIRLYSAEIEYSDENVERICTKLRERFDFDGGI